MEYLYGVRESYEDFASGRVLINKPGHTHFPVRLAREIFGRCLRYMNSDLIRVYDPCCGGGYLLTVLGYLFTHRIQALYGSDVDAEALRIAAENLSLLTEAGLAARERQLREWYEAYQKETHLQALESANRLRQLIKTRSITPEETKLFQADITNRHALNQQMITADIVITDIPYGLLTSWHGEGEGAYFLLENIIPVLHTGSVVAICSDKRQKINHAGYKRLEKHQIGKRKFEILQSINQF